MARRETSSNENKERTQTSTQEASEFVDATSGSIYELLMDDHRKVKELFSQIEAASESNFKEMKELFKELRMELEAHDEAERRAFYDVLKKEDETEMEALKAFEEHAIVVNLLSEAAQARAQEKFKAKVEVLRELVEHHIEEEEGTIFPKARSVLDEGDEIKIGEKFAKLKEKKLSLH